MPIMKSGFLSKIYSNENENHDFLYEKSCLKCVGSVLIDVLSKDDLMLKTKVVKLVQIYR